MLFVSPVHLVEFRFAIQIISAKIGKFPREFGNLTQIEKHSGSTVSGSVREIRHRIGRVRTRDRGLSGMTGFVGVPADDFAARVIMAENLDCGTACFRQPLGSPLAHSDTVPVSPA